MSASTYFRVPLQANWSNWPTYSRGGALLKPTATSLCVGLLQLLLFWPLFFTSCLAFACLLIPILNNLLLMFLQR